MGYTATTPRALSPGLCRRRPLGSSEERLVSHYSATTTFSAGPGAVLAAAFHVFRNDWGRMPEQGPRGVSTLTPLSGSGTSGAENVTLFVTGVGPQGTTVTVRSESAPLVFTAGRRNQRNVEHAIRRVGEHLASDQAAG
jgi:hypothetical protein